MKLAGTTFPQRALGVAVALALAAPAAECATITVDSSDDSAASAACNLRHALESVNAAVAMADARCAPRAVSVAMTPFRSLS